MARLIYHSEDDDDRRESPFDMAIREIADSDTAWLVCPYISPGYLRCILENTEEWRVITDVEAWVGAFGESARREIQKLVESNQDRIRNIRDIHAKVVVSDDSAILGSANLTEKGVTGRREMGVQFDEDDIIEELQDWFLSLWSKSSSIDLDELQNHIQSLSATPTTHSETTSSVTSEAPRVNASFVTQDTLSEDGLESDDEARETLVDILQMAPSQEWADSFFDLLADVILTWELESDDPRLVTSIAQKDRIAVSINNRYVLGAFPADEPSTGFIIDDRTKNVESLIEAADEYMAFEALSGESEDETPHWVEYRGYPKRMMNDSFRRGWMKAISDELNRASGSPYQRYHEPLVYQMALDEEYREQILRDAFNKSDSTDESHTSRGIKQALCRMDMPRGQVTLLKYLYENDRPVSVEELANGIRGGDVDSCTSILGPLSKRINNTPEVAGEPGFCALIRKTQNEEQNYYELREEGRRIIGDIPRLLSEFERDMDELRKEENPVIEGSEFEENQG